jgi:hypothetical protein
LIQPQIYMDELKQLIQNIFNLDQQLRKQNVWKVEYIHEFNEFSTEILKDAISQFGIPMSETVGQETVDHFTILLSHCTDLSFVESILNDKNFINPSVNKEDLAIVYDNLLVKNGKKQLYGSVLNIIEKEDGTLESVPLPMEDPENVNIRRKNFGINTTLEEYIENASKMLKKINR